MKTLNNQRQNQCVNTTRRYKRTDTKKQSLGLSLRNQNQQSNELLFGLKPVDFNVVPRIYRGAPPPPPKPGLQKYLFPFTIAVTLGLTAYFYFNNENDSKDYWMAMQTGGVLPGTYDDDDDDDDDDDFEYEDEDEE